jgi:thiol-disulfide isomerase/thioredoxin
MDRSKRHNPRACRYPDRHLGSRTKDDPMRFAKAALLALLISACGDAEKAADDGTVPDPPAVAQSNDATEEASGTLVRELVGTPMPPTIFQDPSGTDVTLADFKGKPLLLNLWATWCAPCITEMPTLDALAARDPDRLQVLVVSQDLNGAEKVDAFFEEHRFARLQPYVDPEAQLSTDLKVTTLPTTILYDANGRELWRLIGIEDWRGARAASLLKEAMKPH